jgi:RND family efflux transporter MFP subunit
MVKIFTTFIMLALVAGLLVLPLGCQAAPTAGVAQTPSFTVTRGDLSTEITASGNLVYLLEKDVTFDITGTAVDPVTVKDILVEVGESVKKGQALVKVDVGALENQVSGADLAYQQSQLAFLQAQIAYKQQQYARDSAKMSLDAANRAVEQAQPKAGTTYTYFPNMAAIDSSLGQALATIDESLGLLQEGQPVVPASVLNLLRQYLVTAKDASATTIFVSVGVGQRVGDAVNSLQALLDAQTTAKQNLEKAELSLQSAKKSVDVAQMSLDRSKTSLDDAKTRLGKSILYAPFDGFVTAIPVSGGFNVSKGLIAAKVADPDKFEAMILVSEKDIDKVSVGTEGYVTSDTLSAQFPAKVTAVSPTATISSGVVNYRVTVEITSQGVAATAPSGTIVNQSGKLRQGLTVAITIQTDKRTGVLRIPKSAVTRRNGQSYVSVVTAVGTTVETAIQTGLSDWQYTEVINGLNEGDKVLLPATASSTAAPKSTSSMPGAPSGSSNSAFRNGPPPGL